jgi:hypothetical protein
MSQDYVACGQEGLGDSCLHNDGVWQEDNSYTPQIDDYQVLEWRVVTQKGANEGEATVMDGGGPTFPEGVLDGKPAQNWIVVKKWRQGDAIIEVDMEWCGHYFTLKTEKKWGHIHHTILDLHHDPADSDTWAYDPVFPETEIPGEAEGACDAATPFTVNGYEGEPIYENIADWVIGHFLDASTDGFTDRAAHAVVHWWLIEDSEDNMDYLNEYLLDYLNSEPVYDLPEDACSSCGNYNEETPKDLIDELAFNIPSLSLNTMGAQYAEHTDWESAYPVFDDLDSTLTYGRSMTADDIPTDIRGLAQAEMVNYEDESVIVVVLVEYPEDYDGENPVCVEIGRKKFTRDIMPIQELVKTPQLRWAGEKVVLEQDLAGVVDSKTDYIATFHLEGQSVGELSGGGETRYRETSEGDIWVWVNSEDAIPECILETEVQGEADINLKLYIPSNDSDYWNPEEWELKGSPIVNYGFLVYFLAFEDVRLTTGHDPLDPDSPIANITPDSTFKNLPVDDDVPVAVQVRGWFKSDELPGTSRVAVDLNGDYVYELPAGRYVMPDDWWALANHNIHLRPNWDLMDSAHEDNIDSEHDATMPWDGEEGPYDTNKATDPPGEAEAPTIGPFNTLQIWSNEMMWEASATVPTSDPDYDARNTVVPDGLANTWDCPMPQALVDFEITGRQNVVEEDTSLSTLDKGELVGYGVNEVSGNYESPFYQMEIPSHMYIPANDYAWASWDGQGPYDMWTDLFVRDVDDMEYGQGTPVLYINDDDVEVYSDNHGIAGVTVDAIGKFGTVTITATADYPASLKKGKYGPVKSDGITIEWGLVEFDPDFIGIPRTCDDVEGCTVTFQNLTEGGTPPYKSATWDFGDGTDPVTVVDNPATLLVVESMANVPHTYAIPGIFDITLTMKDADDVVAFQVELDYIEVGTGGEPPVDYHTWTFNFDGFVPRCLDEDYQGTTYLADLDPATIPACVQGVYYEDGTFWAPDAPGTTLAYLGGSQDPLCYMISVIPTPCSWTIPLMP